VIQSFLICGSALGVAAVLHGVGLPWTATARAGLWAVLLFLPIGDLVLPRWRGVLTPGERLVLAFLVGYPASATLFYLHMVAGAPFPFVLLLVAFGVLAAWRRLRERTSVPPPGDASPAGSLPLAALLAVLVPIFLWILMRDARVYEPTPDALYYDHSVDYPDHLAVYWELWRHVPPQHIPTVAGLPAPRYHILGFMPGLFLARHAGFDFTVVHHLVIPSLRLLLLMGGVYLAVRLYTRERGLALAGLLSVFCITPAVGHALEGRIVDAASPSYFFLTSESTGSATVLWLTISILLLIAHRDGGLADRRALLLASALAGLSYGFKAQIFLLMTGAFGASALLFLIRERRREYAWALLMVAAGAAFVFFSWRAPLTRGLPRFTPGLFAEIYMYPALAADRWAIVRDGIGGTLQKLPAGVAGVVATVLGVWRLMSFSPFVPLWLADLVRARRRAGLAETVFALACLFALPLGYAFSVKAIDQVVSPYEFIQAVQCLPYFAALVNVIALAALLRRWSAESVTWTVRITAVAAAAVVPLVLTGKTVRTPHRSVWLGPDEVCALLYLRNQTPMDAIVVTARGDGAPPQSLRLNYHPVVTGLAGRRSVLEYFWKEVDTSTNRVAAIRRLFTTEDAAEGESILHRFAVTHVLEYGGRPLRFSSPALVRVYDAGTVRVYRFGPESPGPLPVLPPAYGWSCVRAQS